MPTRRASSLPKSWVLLLARHSGPVVLLHHGVHCVRCAKRGTFGRSHALWKGAKMLRGFVSGRRASSTIAIAIAGVPLLFLSGCGDAAAPAPEDIRPVRTVVVEPKPIDDDRQSVGEIRPRQESDIGFQVGG